MSQSFCKHFHNYINHWTSICLWLFFQVVCSSSLHSSSSLVLNCFIMIMLVFQTSNAVASLNRCCLRMCWQCSTEEYLLLIQHEVCKSSSTEGLHVFRVLPQNGTEIKHGCLSLTQQHITPRSLQERICCIATFLKKKSNYCISLTVFHFSARPTVTKSSLVK